MGLKVPHRVGQVSFRLRDAGQLLMREHLDVEEPERVGEGERLPEVVAGRAGPPPRQLRRAEAVEHLRHAHGVVDQAEGGERGFERRDGLLGPSQRLERHPDVVAGGGDRLGVADGLSDPELLLVEAERLLERPGLAGDVAEGVVGAGHPGGVAGPLVKGKRFAGGLAGAVVPLLPVVDGSEAEQGPRPPTPVAGGAVEADRVEVVPEGASVVAEEPASASEHGVGASEHGVVPGLLGEVDRARGDVDGLGWGAAERALGLLHVCLDAAGRLVRSADDRSLLGGGWDGQ